MLALSIDAEGRVTEATIHTSGGTAFDAAALEAAQSSSFHPAERDGVALPSRILFEMIFSPPEEAETNPEPEEPKPSSPETPTKTQAPKPAAEDEPDAPSDSEILVRGSPLATQLRRSAYAVQVVELAEAKRQSADLGEVLARRTPVSVQRSGGLGSRGSYSLAGLGGDRLRFFLNGVPLEYTGFTTGIANVPVQLIERIEVYQGVVPIRFGADALGGAVHLVSDEDVRSNRASASYQVGSFNTHRATLSGRYYHKPTGLFARGSLFLDSADNDYPVDVNVFDELGRLSPATLRRFHDDYLGTGAQLAVGVVDRPWADRLVLQGFVSSFDQEVQNNATMEIPYGEVSFARQNFGGNLRYTKSWGRATRLDATAGYARFDARFTDLSNCRYDWYGRCYITLPSQGEILGRPVDQQIHTDTGFLRADVSHELTEGHSLRASFAPTYANRTGRDQALLPGSYDPLQEPQRLLTGVLGVEYEAQFLERRLANIAFVKGYGISTQSREMLGTGVLEDRSYDHLQFGGGNSLRYLVTDELYLKASYEYATRLPNTNEMFGDGMLTLGNLRLRPEVSHNVNVGAFVDAWNTSEGQFRASVNGFARVADNLILLLAQGDFLQYRNVLTARVLGFEAAAGWTNPSDWFGLDGRITYQNLRNTSDGGDFSAFEGDRLPNLPYLQGNTSAFLRTKKLVVPGDTLELTWNMRYVHGFLRSWESVGTEEMERLSIPNQLTQSLSLSYLVRGDDLTIHSSLEAQNLTNEKVFDFYGVQRPGRAFFAKMALDY